MTEYKAILRGINKLERPLQGIFYSFSSVSDWSEKVLARHPTGYIEIYQSIETLLTKSYGARFNAICVCGCEQKMHLNSTSTGETSKWGACRSCECKKYEERV